MYVTIKSNPKHTVLKKRNRRTLTSIEDPEKALAPTLPTLTVDTGLLAFSYSYITRCLLSHALWQHCFTYATQSHSTMSGSPVKYYNTMNTFMGLYNWCNNKEEKNINIINVIIIFIHKRSNKTLNDNYNIYINILFLPCCVYPFINQSGW
jgi:hypothetical protein